MMKKKLTTPKIILFDWHATLVDTFDAMYHAIDDVIAKIQRLGLLTRLTREGESKHEEDAKLVAYVREHHALPAEIAVEKKLSRTEIFEILFDCDEDAKEIAHLEFNNCYRDHFGEIHPFEDDTDKMLYDLLSMGIRLGVMTNRDRKFIEREINVIQINGWGHYFETLVCGDDVINRKPAPDLIFKALENMQAEPGMDCWYVGDSTTDTASAKKAGVTNVFFNGAHWDQDWLDKLFPGTKKHPYKPDAVVENNRELMQLVTDSLNSEQTLQ